MVVLPLLLIIFLLILKFSPVSLANITIVKDALVAAGFIDIHTEYLNVVFEFASAEDYTIFAKEIIAPLQDMLAKETERRREEIWKALAEKIERKYVPLNNNNNLNHNRSIKIDNETICIVGRK